MAKPSQPSPSPFLALNCLPQGVQQVQLQREASQRLNALMDEMRNSPRADMSAKNLGNEGAAFIVEALAFNSMCVTGLEPDQCTLLDVREPQVQAARVHDLPYDASAHAVLSTASHRYTLVCLDLDDKWR